MEPIHQRTTVPRKKPTLQKRYQASAIPGPQQGKRLSLKQIPRQHIVLASILSAVLFAVTTMMPEESAHGDRLASDQQLPRLASMQSQLADQVGPQPMIGPMQPKNHGWTELTVAPGDTLSSIFNEVGLSAQELHRLIDTTDEATVLNRLRPGYQLSFHIPSPGELRQLQVLTSPLEGFVYKRYDARYEVEPVLRTPDIREVVRQGEISDSLFLAAQRADIPANVIMGMADVFGGVIDFLLDPRQGDRFSIIYQEKYLDGEYVGPGEIIGAQFINRGREHIAVRYENTQGESGFFSPTGESMQKAFLRNPLDVFRISSNFNPNRRHPILNTIRAHKGTDYAAPTGTPVRATADGTVTWAARNGSFGKLVVIEHHGSYETKYAHLNDYADGIRKGSRVRQGQVIGYVGATGGATGPHLHYEFLVSGVHKDPRTIVDQLPQAVTLEPAEMPRFLERSRAIIERFPPSSADSRLLTLAGPALPSLEH
ncbi:peptidoglycan DD-metalloendopeptidase family protein [Pseudohongiella sp. SYSU M77423]|uniref:peptidoglycan DD-metalloendopeptidase family protein n=1 Tax=unclassified Pseudohongiella TaxID=2629611 RepID=UPI000C693D6D|nr:MULTISPECIES: peptidoglycan DD-metalloendopeptidase family protein [unclassified Pseudohongiella]MAY55731.1 peptidase M23 [Gammaproteobacteria bacterium]MBJ54040.1 peptidase M23 [Gammaproteobacteria bacterium]MDH7944081.1 peptidoglycan DD-metalloendopeptidase family protein [Pseudohongiella sp. SYSU M77423]